ncbi:MAG: two pore domain potassium channel family protein [Planctomycetes bacterium]|nr:two pore domain potassium channel family protein [Planctomycetota bacterium]
MSGVGVLCALVLAFVCSPFLEQMDGGEILESLLLTVVLSSAVLAVGGDRRAVAWALAFAIPALIGKWTHSFRPDLLHPGYFQVAGALCVGLITLRFLRFIMTVRRVDSNVLCVGVSAFLMLALLWSLAYSFVDRVSPGSFASSIGTESSHKMSGFTSLYFSVVTLCTVGFGDIVPISSPARMLAMMEGMTGVFFIAVMVSRLVSMYTTNKEDPGA